MPSAAQWEKVADQVCQTLGGQHVAARVVCPVGVRLLREVAASRFEGRPGSRASVVDKARLTIRSLARLPDPDAPDDEVRTEGDEDRLPIPAVPHVGRKRRTGRPRGNTRSIADLITDQALARPKQRLKKLMGFARHAVSGGFIPGEEGF